MKKLLLIIAASVPAIVYAQDGKYTITGSLNAQYSAPGKVYLERNVKGKRVTDSVVINGGHFQFEGTIGTSPQVAALVFNTKGTGASTHDYKEIYLEQGNIAVTSADSLLSAKATGTPTNEDNERYNAIMKPINDDYDLLEVKQNAASKADKESEVYEKEYNKAEKAIEQRENALNKKFIQDNPNSYISLTVLQSFAYGSDYAEIAPLYDNLSPAIMETDAGKKFAALLPRIKAVALGATAPEFAEADTSGTMVSISSFKGKYVLIDFWASWCGPCRHENPNVVKAFNRFKGQNFTIVGVSLDRPNAKDKWLNAIHKDGLTWTQVSDLKFWNSEAAQLYAVQGIPQNFLLDPNGKIIAKNLRGDDLEEKLEELFGKI
ncbi:redoxin domain-containing protein [Mucilaginibacter sp. X4EP1]|uniref:TlpA disulfide reductase family protein n=1 Tax=Mucilaginibacter sp. X4EP1 TaxID=2723092 RepID=UPI002169C17A|nr:TlpA disulfide reductase family protein [Mucilaginibacter sp. X4EP1]MCS3816602.1 peroxiredoxin [Mucilaginibacter sp. X4EP1]